MYHHFLISESQNVQKVWGERKHIRCYTAEVLCAKRHKVNLQKIFYSFIFKALCFKSLPFRNSILETYPDIKDYIDNFLPKKDQFKVLEWWQKKLSGVHNLCRWLSATTTSSCWSTVQANWFSSGRMATMMYHLTSGKANFLFSIDTTMKLGARLWSFSTCIPSSCLRCVRLWEISWSDTITVF